MRKSTLFESLGITSPIIQAPMAGGVTTPALVAAVSNAGGLGMIGAGYLKPTELTKQIREVKELTDKPFGVNLFIPKEPKVEIEKINDAKNYLLPIRNTLSLPIETPDYLYTDHYEEHLHIVCEEGVEVCSFTFGIPREEEIARLKARDILVVGTATTVKEAIENEEAGIEAIVVQGSEAGGHRGTFLTSDGMIGLMSLIPQVSDNVTIPIIAAGGIMDGRGVKAAMVLGAEAVQMGTAFLTCMESGAHPIYKKAVLEANDDDTVLTKAFSGKNARGIKNKFIQEMKQYEDRLPEFPIVNSLTSEIRKASAAKETPDYMSLWSGQSPTLAREESASTLVARIVAELDSFN